MLKTWQYIVLNALGVVALMLVAANAILATKNRTEQTEINQRQVFIQQTVSLEVLYREMVKGLADLAVRHGDRRVLEALAAQGVNVSVNPPLPASAPAEKR